MLGRRHRHRVPPVVDALLRRAVAEQVPRREALFQLLQDAAEPGEVVVVLRQPGELGQVVRLLRRARRAARVERVVVVEVPVPARRDPLCRQSFSGRGRGAAAAAGTGLNGPTG